MIIEVIRDINTTTREVWDFTLMVSTSATIYLDYYAYQLKDSARCRKWKNRDYWSRLMHRDCTIVVARLPKDVEEEARSKFASVINSLEITE